jgi:predicted ATPase
LEELPANRYEVRRELGRGGAGVVYEAFDTQAGTLVALKTIESPTADDLLRLKHEFRVLADVHHRNLVRYGELTSERGQWFFTMELVRGKNFIDHVRSSGASWTSNDVTRSETRLAPSQGSRAVAPLGAASVGGTFDEARLRAVLAQLASVLLAVHAAGHVHRDVKPSNVLVTDDGRVVLLDFGLVTALGDGEEWVVGTPAFMAPEQAEGRAVGPQADWYSVGVMLFVALTGCLPFDGSAQDIVGAKLVCEAPSPDERASDLPPDLVALCAALLRRSPDERPRGAEIATRLGLSASEIYPSSVRSSDSSMPFVGRVAEIHALESALERVTAGGGATVVIAGEPGIGKTSLVQKFLASLKDDVLVLSGRCYEQETVPFKGIDGIVDSLSEHLVALPDGEVEALLGGGVRYLSTIFPVLHRVPAIEREASSVRDVADPSALREQAFGELERLLSALAGRQTVVLFVDDLQWADKDSLDLLHRLLHGVGRIPFLFLATLRTGGDAAWGAFELANKATRVTLSMLSVGESRALLDALSTTPNGTATKNQDALIDEAQGHPLFLAELARGMRSGAAGVSAHGQLQDVLWGRVAERDAVDRRLMQTVAVAGAPIPYDVVAKAASIEVGDCQTRLGSLRAAQLLRVSRRGEDRLIQPYHDRIREAVLARLGGETAVAQIHLRLGRALTESTPEDALPARIFAIVHHLNAARDFIVDGDERRRLAELDLLASRQAILATAYARACDYAHTGLALLGEAAWSEAYELTRDLHLARMGAELYAGDASAAKQCFDDAMKSVTSPTDATSFSVAWIGLQTSRGQLVEAIATGREALRALGTPMPSKASALSVLKQYARCRYLQGRRKTNDLLHLPELAHPVHEAVIELVVALAPAAFFIDTNLLAWLELEGVALSLKHGVSPVSSYSFAVYGTVLSAVFGKHEEGDAFGRLALALNERFHNTKLAARLHFLYGGWHANWVRPFRDGVEFLRTAHQLATKYGDTAYETYAASTRALVCFSESSDLVSLKAMAEWAQQIGARRQDKDMTGFAEVFARYAAALAGATPSATDLSLATSSDADFRATLSDEKTPSSIFYYLYCNAELAYLAGDPARAFSLLEEAWRRTQIVFGLPTKVDLHLLDALVVARLHDDAAWGARMRMRRRVAQRVKMLRVWAASCPRNFEPHYHVACAELARIRGDVDEAEACFERAVTAARAHRSVKREALAHDLAATLAGARGDESRADTSHAAAQDAYRRWGATTKSDAGRPGAR